MLRMYQLILGGYGIFEKQYFCHPKLGSLYIGLSKISEKIFSPHINSIASPHIFENRFLSFPHMPQSSRSCISKEIFAIDMVAALKPFQNTIASTLCNCYNYMEIVTKIKLLIKQALHSPYLCLHIHIVCLKNLTWLH